jgi:hypothetical protein
MKGITFNTLEEMVIAHQGMEVWNGILNQGIPDGGIYKVGESDPIFIQKAPDFKSFLKSIELVIHVEVTKLHDNPHLPHFEYSELADDILIMQYNSPSKLCILAEELIRGAAAHYKSAIEVGCTICMPKGAKECDLIIRFL